jgi:molybdenum cofactor cytidylyltransferase
MAKVTSDVRVFAIVPAAGRSRRMGRAKQLVKVGEKSMLAAVIDALTESKVAGVLAVLNSTVASHFQPSERLAIVLNDDPATEMIDSIRIGIAHWSARETLRVTDGILICTGDQPGISTADINRCIESFASDPTRMVIATHHGKRGHPLIFPREMSAIVNSSVCDGGLNQLPRHFPARVVEIEASAEVIRNINTPQDLS